MHQPPLTHHDIVRHAGALTRRGYKINLSASDRTLRYIEFEAQKASTPDCTVIYSLLLGKGGVTRITRLLAHTSGLLSTLAANATDLDSALDAFDNFSENRQLDVQNDYVLARSYILNHKSSGEDQLQLRFACVRVAGLELRIDASASSAMPADVRLLIAGTSNTYLRGTLADGDESPLLHRARRSLPQNAQFYEVNHTIGLAEAESHKLRQQVRKLPDDLLAVLGPQWRPLVFQGDHWKGVLRLLGAGDARTQRAETWLQIAIGHLASTLSQNPEQYHVMQNSARWRVYVRRLRPVMLFIGILSLMPISWLFVSGGDVQMHPLALGLTPLLMVGVVALTAREIPVMEIPPRPAPLTADFWST